MKQNFISLTLKDVLIVGWTKQIQVFLIDVDLQNSKISLLVLPTPNY